MDDVSAENVTAISTGRVHPVILQNAQSVDLEDAASTVLASVKKAGVDTFALQVCCSP